MGPASVRMRTMAVFAAILLSCCTVCKGYSFTSPLTNARQMHKTTRGSMHNNISPHAITTPLLRRQPFATSYAHTRVQRAHTRVVCSSSVSIAPESADTGKSASVMANALFRKTWGMLMDEPLLYSDIQAQDKGTMKVTSSDGDTEIEYMWAAFGPRELIDAPVIMCDPERADAEISNAEQMKGKIAVVKRGKNSFAEKALRAQEAGAIGVIIINTEDVLVKAGGSDKAEVKFLIPVALVKSSSAAALAAASVEVKMVASAAPVEEVDAGVGSVLLPMLTHSVPLLPFEHMDITVSKEWAQHLKLEKLKHTEEPSNSSNEVSHDAKETVKVAMFFAESDGEVASIGTMAEIVEVLGAAQDTEQEGKQETDATKLPRRSNRLRVRVVGTGTRLLFSSLETPASSSAPAKTRSSVVQTASFAYGGEGLKDLLLTVAAKVPAGLPAQGGWGEAGEAVAAMIAAAEQEETTAGGVLERVGWVAASLLPLAPQQRQHVLQSLSPDMRAMALSHLLNRVNERYDTTRAYMAHEQEQLDVSSPSRPTASRGLAAVAQKVLPSTVKILPTLLRDSQSKGSGFVVSHSTREDGGLDAMIVTNSHVAGLTVGMEVVLYDGRVFKGSLVGRHRELDIALVQVSLPVGAAALPQVEWGDSDALLPADYAVAIGNPGDLDNIVTMGVVSGMIRPVTGGGVSTAFVMQSSRFHTGKHTLLDRSVSYIVTDAKVSGGMSGGPLLDSYGRVIGVNTFLRPDLNNMAFAIASNRVKDAIEDISLLGQDTSELSVWLMNDRMNTKERVSAVLKEIAGLSAEEAEKVMMQAHTKGASSIATLPKEEAQALVQKMLERDVLAECRSASSAKPRLA